MITLSKDAANKLALQLSIGDSVCQRDPDGARTFDVQTAPILDADGLITGYHHDLWVVVAYSPWTGATHVL